MKLKALFLNLLTLITLNSFAQNWNVFNKDYRYNYIYNNNALVTNVLFVDTVKQIGTDTVYSMNRIGIECTGTCPTITVAITTTATVIVPNMPQFLQRSITKYANGLVMLHDTAKLVIKPNCILNETWLFDSINNKIAQCTNLSTEIIFSSLDSVKTILIDGTDTLKLSKQFGIIQFPDLYSKNKYYRLVGVENAASYDQIALYGLKVPNAWDFYNFDVGDVFCYNISSRNIYGASSHNYYSGRKKITILSKTMNSWGYSYITGISEISQGSSTSPLGSNNTNTNSYTSTTTNYSITSMYNENTIYPGKIIYESTSAYDIGKFGIDGTGRFYKYAGPGCSKYGYGGNSPCSLNPSMTFPNFSEQNSYYYPNASSVMVPSTDYFTLLFGSGLGQINVFENYYWGWHTYFNDQVYAKKNGIDYFGTECDLDVGIKETSLQNQHIEIYPNPANNEIIINSKGNKISKIELTNNLGQIVSSKQINDLKTTFNLADYSNGVYFLKIYSESNSLVKKLIIEH